MSNAKHDDDAAVKHGGDDTSVSSTKQPALSLMTRFAALQKNRTLIHPKLPQKDGSNGHHQDRDHADTLPAPDNNSTDPSSANSSSSFSFVVTADTQFGMLKNNVDWEDEMKWSRRAVQQINALHPRPLFCIVCGDLVHMTAEIEMGKTFTNRSTGQETVLTREACDEIQDAQNRDFQQIWSDIHPDIPLVCLCGNHDVGQRPTPLSIARFRRAYGDDYLAFWVRQTYNIVVNTALFSDPSGAPDMYQEQFEWLRGRLQYAKRQQASHIFVFGHHPWFLYNENEDEKDLTEGCPLQEFGIEGSISDGYFVIPLVRRRQVMELFREFGVTAAFAGHFHQNMVSQSSFGMPMITTSALSVLLRSTGIPKDFNEPKTRGMRLVYVNQEDGTFQHKFVSLED